MVIVPGPLNQKTESGLQTIPLKDGYFVFISNGLTHFEFEHLNILKS